MTNAWVRKELFIFDLSKAIRLCKNPFIGGPCRVEVDLSDTLYYHTPFYIGVEVLQVAVLL